MTYVINWTILKRTYFQKGQNTIDEFGLNDEYHTLLRGGHISLVNNGLAGIDTNNLLINILSGDYHYSS